MIPGIVERVATGTPVFLEPREEDEMDCRGLKFSICYVNDAAQLVSEFSSVKRHWLRKCC